MHHPRHPNFRNAHHRRVHSLCRPRPNSHWNDADTRLIEIASPAIVHLEPTATLVTAARLTARLGISSLLVLAASGQLLGILTEHDLLQAMHRGLPPETPLPEVMTAPVITVPPAITCHDAYQLCLARNIRHLVIVDAEGRPLAVATETDFRRHLKLDIPASQSTVAMVMNRAVDTLPPSAPLHDALALMADKSGAAIIVTEGDTPVGILTERDVARLYSRQEPVHECPLAEIMSAPVQTIPAGSSLTAAAERMMAAKIRQIPVVDHNGDLVGLLNARALTRVLALHMIDNSLRQEQQRALSLLEVAPFPIVISRLRDGRIRYCNPRMAQRWHLAQEALLNLPVTAFYQNPDDREHLIADVQAGGSVIDREMRLQDSDGQLIHASVASAIIHFENEPSLLSAINDISERKLAEDQLRQERAKFHTIFRAIPDLVWFKDLTGTYQACNRSFERFFGTRQAAILGKSDYDFVDRGLADFFRAHDQKAIEAGGPVTNEEWLTFAEDGAQGLFETIKTPVADEDGTILGVLGIAREVTERRRMERDLRERIKEQQCLHEIAALTEDIESPWAEQLQQVVERIAPGWQFPEITAACLECGELCLSTPLFRETPWMQSVETLSKQGTRIRLRIAYLDERPSEDEGPFFQEERRLAEAIVQRLADALDRRRFAEQVEERDQIIAAMFAQTTDAIVLVDPETLAIVDCNEVAHTGLGYSREEFAGLSIKDVQAEHSADEIRSNTAQAAEGPSLRFTTQHRHKNGSLRDVRVTLRPITLNERVLLSSVWQDITEDKARERLIVENAARLRRHNELLGRIATARSALDGDLPGFAREVAALLGETLDIGRVSIWLTDDGDGLPICLERYAADPAPATDLDPATVSVLAGSLDTGRSIAIADVRTDTRLPAAFADRLAALTTALLGCAIVSSGRRRGMLCLEQGHQTRHWQADEIAFACQIADHLGMALLNRERLDAVQALAHSEQLLMHAQEVAKTGSWQFAFATRTLSWSAQTYRIFGLPPTDAVTLHAYAEKIHPDDFAAVHQAWHAAQADGSGAFHVVHRVLVDSACIWVEQRATIEFDSQGQPVMALGIVQDITRSKENEERLRQLNRMHVMLARTGEAIVRNRDGQHLLEQVCQILVEIGGFSLAWAGMVTEEGQLLPVAKAGAAPGWVERLDPALIEETPLGLALRSGQPQIVNDLAAPGTEAWRSMGQEGGSRTLGLFPVVVDGRTQALIGVHRVKAHWFNPELTDLCHRLASTVGLALEAAAATEKALEEQRFRQTLVDSVAGLFHAVDSDGRLVLWNRRTEEVTGRNAEQLATMPVLDHFRPEDRQLVADRIAEAFREGESMAEAVIVAADGRQTPFLFHTRRVEYKGRMLIVGSAVDISSRVEAVRQLQESERRLQGITDSALDAILMIDPAGTISYWNPAAERILGYSAKEALGHDLHRLLVPKRFQEAHLTAFQAFRHTGKGKAVGKTLEMSALHRDGRELTVALSMSAVRLDDAWHAVGILRDITEIKRAEVALQTALAEASQAVAAKNEVLAHLEELVASRTQALDAALEQLKISEERYTLALDATADGLWDWDIRSGQFYVSPAYCRMLGYEPDELPASSQGHFVDLIHPDDRARVLATTQEQLEQAGSYEIEFRKRAKSGAYLWILSRGKTVARDEAGRPLRAVGMHTDLTARKRIELALRLAYEEQQAIFDAATTGIVFIRDRHILRCNRQLEQFFGYGAGEFSGQTTRCWYASEAEYLAMGEEVAEQLRTVRRHTAVRQLVRKDGSLFWARMSAQAIDPDDLGKGLVGMVEDITSERAASEALRIAKEAAEAATRAKSEFLANMSHEIRTPMNAIIGFSHLLRRDPLTPQQSRQLDKLAEASRHLLRIINDILDISKIEASKMTLEIEDFEPARVIDHVCAIMADPVAAKGLDLHVDLDHLPSMLRGDGARLGQILLNLIGNAVKFTEQGQIDIVARIVAEDTAQVVTRFEVRDTGIGMSEEQLQRIFVAFEQADSSTTRRFGGTGLGLAISKRLVELMGGSIGTDSTLGQGTRFWIELPLARSTQLPAQRLPVENLRNMHTLVIEDLADSREILAAMLGELGMRVETAPSGEEGLAAVLRADRDNDPFALLIIDWRLPGISGIETAARLRTLGMNASPAFLIITAYGDQMPRQEAEAAGVLRVMAKPVTPSVLHDTLTEMLLPSIRYRQPKSAAEQELARRRGAHILLVEDNPINQEVAQALLESMGMQVSVADNGKTALDMIASAPFDLVCMDIQMPVMDGLQATQAIRLLPDRQALPIVAMTANAFSEDRDRCLAAGMNDHIAKPIEQEVLQQLLIHWLPEQSPAPPETSAPAPAQDQGADLDERLGRIDGLDAQAGLRRLRGKTSRYLQLLHRFIADHRNDVDQLTVVAKANDLEALRTHAHGIKGVAGTLGAVRIEREAAALETLAKTGNREAAVDALLLIDRLHQALAALAGVLPPLPTEEPPRQPAPVAVDTDELFRVLTEIAALLRMGDTSVADLIETIKPHLQAAFGASTVAQLDQEIQDFDYPAALTSIRQLLASAASD